MDHILITCPATGQSIIWDLARKIWCCTGRRLPSPSLGMILASPSANHKNKEGHSDSGDNSFYRILVSESAHLIWKLRCEWRISHDGLPSKHISPQEAASQWHHAISLWIVQDVISEDSRCYSKKAIVKETVDATWEKILGVENFWKWSLEEVVEFLVGIPLGQPPG
ncbi:hypothetical protein M422DRAFT_150808 [Sphaerobolus stellatus SS14]|nr:hypothetical protein M422DRAFT_150808 [Sphaerobolus stellatus SS14]